MIDSILQGICFVSRCSVAWRGRKNVTAISLVFIEEQSWSFCSRLARSLYHSLSAT